jgi:hypothetical protein
MHTSPVLWRSLLFAAVLCLTAGCASQTQLTCAEGQELMRSESLYFGTNKPGSGIVTESEWQAFLNEEVTPRFPDGLSIFRATGQWKPKTGPVVVEASYVLNVIHLNKPKQYAAFAELVAAYKTRFSQETVLQVSAPACAAF